MTDPVSGSPRPGLDFSAHVSGFGALGFNARLMTDHDDHEPPEFY
jgi:hypothetical protein